MPAYEFFAEVYDGLTNNVPYVEQAHYLQKLCAHYGHEWGLTLDLACGTGSLTVELAKQGVDIFGVDMSCDMLSVAQRKAAEAGEQILFLCQSMQGLNLYSSVDTCICTLDSINHLPNAEDVRKTFQNVYRFLNPGGLFLFDVNTLYKHRKVLAGNTFVYDTNAVYCVWQNELQEDLATVEITLDFFLPDNGQEYVRYSEQFCERAYTNEEMEQMLKETGFCLLSVFAEQSMQRPKEDTQRQIYVVQKPKNG